MQQPAVINKIGAAYIRVSTDDQTELSPDAQLREILKAAKADGVIIPQEFIFMEARGRSGRRADNRPEFQRMISTAKQKPSPFQYLYLWKFSRFARNQDESTFYKGILRKKCGVTIKSVSEPIMEGMFGRLVEMIIEWSDEFYSINLSGEVIRGMTEKAIKEGYQATPCLGYDAVGKGKPFVINEVQYTVAAFIHRSYYEGKDFTSIAREANARGYRTRRGNPFTNRSVQNILTNSFYVGIVKWKDITFQGTHEVREEITAVFAANQERLKNELRPAGRRDVSSCAHWLSGLLKCSTCGASLGYNPAKHSRHFQCWKYSKGIHKDSCSISIIKAEKALLSSLEKVLAAGEVEFSHIRTAQAVPSSDLDRLHHALERLKLKELRVKEAYENGIDTLEEYKENRIRLKEEQNQLTAELAQLEQKESLEGAYPDQAEVLKRIQSVYELISNPDIDFETKGNALRRIVNKIVFDRKSNTMKFFYYVQK